MTREPTPESLMAHTVPCKSRARLRWPLRLSAPRCPVCRKWEHPDYDHSACKEESP